MNTSQLHDALTKLALQEPFLQREIAVLKRKKVAKVDPYSVLYTTLLYLYCVKDTGRFLDLFRQFIEAEMDAHFAQMHDLWFFVEGSILLYSDLTGDAKHDYRIRAKGFVEDRLEGSMLDLNSGNLKEELGELKLGNPLPKETIVRRYESLIGECVAILRLKKGGAKKEVKARLDRYRQLFIAAVGCFRLRDEDFVAGLKSVSKDLV